MKQVCLLSLWIALFGSWLPTAQAETPKPPPERATTATPAQRRPPTPRIRPASPKNETIEGIALYKQLLKEAKSKQPSSLFKALRAATKTTQAPTNAKKHSFIGNVRIIKATQDELFLARELDGTLHILALPADAASLKKGASSPYAALRAKAQHKLKMEGVRRSVNLHGAQYSVFQLTATPERQLLDRLFFLLIIALLFFTMVGMGMTLTGSDFARIAQKPRGMIVGPLCQFGLLPLCAFAVGHLFGFPATYPFIFVGMLLVTSSPGGVTSNLMTYFAKGDVALSISLTALSTVLSLFLTPLLIALYAAGIPEVKLPFGTVIVQILILVIVPLATGMLLRAKAESFALRSEKFFSALGAFSLIFLIVVGVLSNLDKFADTERYGLRFYMSVALLPLLGMLLGGAISKLLGVSNGQVRAISLETGLQNSSLAMTLALLLQDRMGDFYSAMFFTSGIFGISMYLVGGLAIWLFPKLLPLSASEQEA
ncbi:MAG: bile acid:sodium symporter family protein [Myxococcales bacterium]|nr:bile acid:sodium symporter family protein [Myxococcales bacterium]